MKKNIFGWICVDAQKTGTWKQAEALAEKWINAYLKKPINLPSWCKWMPPRLFAALPNFLQLLAVKNLNHQLPDVIIAAGRQAVLVAIAMRHKVKTVVLMNPGVPCHYFNAVIAPIHDQITGTNVITTQGALHGIEPDQLIFPQHLQNYQSPRVGVMLGGNSIHGIYEKSLAINLANDLKNFCTKHNASLIITPSRRTPSDWLDIFEQNLKGSSYWLWDQKSENPYPNLLSGVDTIIVCEDSISMASEACVMGKPVLIYPTGIKKEKFKKFYKKLFENGYAQAFCANANINPKQAPVLKEVDRVVEQLNLLCPIIPTAPRSQF